QKTIREFKTRDSCKMRKLSLEVGQGNARKLERSADDPGCPPPLLIPVIKQEPGRTLDQETKKGRLPERRGVAPSLSIKPEAPPEPTAVQSPARGLPDAGTRKRIRREPTTTSLNRTPERVRSWVLWTSVRRTRVSLLRELSHRSKPINGWRLIPRSGPREHRRYGHVYRLCITPSSERPIGTLPTILPQSWASRMVRRGTLTSAHPASERKVPRQKERQATAKPKLARVRAMTLNVNGFASHREEILLLIEKSRPSFLALQETNRTAKHRAIAIPGYDTVESCAGDSPGAHGALIAVQRSKNLSVSEYLSTPYVACLRAVARQPKGPPQQLIVASAYIPCTAHAPYRAQALRDIARLYEKAAGEGIDNILILGDLNMN
ncbi:hypothetical protein NEAUS03_2469, partial [Nematocida ausubeli]